MRRQVSVSVALAITLIAMTLTFSVTMIVSMSIFDNTVSSVVEKQAQYSKLSELDNYVRANYYGEINDATLNDRIAQGYINGVEDKYSIYYSEKEYTEILEYEQGTRVGIGISVVKDADGYFSILRVYSDSPADKAGVTRGGKVIRVDDVDTKTLTNVRAITRLLRGEQGTTVNITCLYGADEKTFEVQRSNYYQPTVEYEKVGDYGYIRIYSFGKNTYTDFDFVISEAIGDGVRGIVFDVRGNTGETYRAAYDVIDRLCPLGVVAKSENKAGVVRNVATSDEEYVDLPMVVLVDANTAAAAEIFAVSIRDLNGGLVAGAKTQGRGMLQSAPQRLSDGSAVVITTAKLLTGRDESFEGVGIAPDIEISGGVEDEFALYDPKPREDTQILRAFEVVRTIITGQGGTAPELVLDEPSASEPALAPAVGEAASGAVGEGDASTPAQEEPAGDSSAASEE